jgi:hypothetical protein
VKDAAIPYENRGGGDVADEELYSCRFAMGVRRLCCRCEGAFVRREGVVRFLRPVDRWAQSVGMAYSAKAILFDAAVTNVLADMRRAAMSMAAKD